MPGLLSFVLSAALMAGGGAVSVGLVALAAVSERGSPIQVVAVLAAALLPGVGAGMGAWLPYTRALGGGQLAALAAAATVSLVVPLGMFLTNSAGLAGIWLSVGVPPLVAALVASRLAAVSESPAPAPEPGHGSGTPPSEGPP